MNGSNPVPGVTVTVSLSSGTLAGTTTATTNSAGIASFPNLTVSAAGTYTLSASASGTTAATSSSFIITAAAGPTITAVSSTTPAGTYPAGTTIPITVTFSAPVTVTGTPTLALNTTPGAVASYAGTPGGTLTTLATFTGANGAIRRCRAVQGQQRQPLRHDRNVAAPSNDGTVFEVAAGTHTLTTLASFTGTNGDNPYAGMVEDSSGNLFGTTDLAARRTMARCSRLRRAPIPLPRWLTLTARTALTPMPAWSWTSAATSSARPPRAARRATARCSRWRRARTPSPPWLPSTARTAAGPPMAAWSRTAPATSSARPTMAARRTMARCSSWRRAPTPLPRWLPLTGRTAPTPMPAWSRTQAATSLARPTWRRVGRWHGVRDGGGHPHPHHPGYL